MSGQCLKTWSQFDMSVDTLSLWEKYSLYYIYKTFGSSFLISECCIAETSFIIGENQKLKIEILSLNFIFLPEITAVFCVKLK